MGVKVTGQSEETTVGLQSMREEILRKDFKKQTKKTQKPGVQSS